MFYQLIYISFSKDDVDLAQIEEIMKKSRTNNIARNITGALLFHRGIFLQLLEGEEGAVKELYGKIQADSRHDNITTILETWTEKRITPTPGIIKVDSMELDVDTINCILQFNKYTTETGRTQISPEVAADIFSKFLELCLKGH